MSALVLDSGPLAVVTQRPGQSREVDDCQAWFSALEHAGRTICVPEIADYELRRELIRAGKVASIARLDALCARTRYLALTTDQMRAAASLWAHARATGAPTAAPDALDADVILAAQALSIGDPGVVIATTNPAHLRRFVPSERWQVIRP